MDHVFCSIHPGGQRNPAEAGFVNPPEACGGSLFATGFTYWVIRLGTLDHHRRALGVAARCLDLLDDSGRAEHQAICNSRMQGWRPILCLSRGMSIYQKFDQGPPSESFVYPVKRQKVVRAPASPKPDASLAEEAQRRKRKGTPTNELLKPTYNWAATLPRKAQPLALMRRFPRIANQLAAVWSETPSLRSYLDGLLVDDRGHRQGFPQDVLIELLSLRLYHASLHPQEPSVWGGGRRRSCALPR